MLQDLGELAHQLPPRVDMQEQTLQRTKSSSGYSASNHNSILHFSVSYFETSRGLSCNTAKYYVTARDLETKMATSGQTKGPSKWF